jgi:class 3 adenylate cyclase/tetratricopeptide (TPR) repeat protein
MDFVAVVDQVIVLLRQRGRVTYRLLQRQFQLDAAALEDLKVELIEGQRLARDERGTVLVWTDDGGAAPAAPPAGTPALPEAERRQLTVLFCDLVGSTALSAQLDPEELREVVRAYQATCAKVIARFEGHIAQYLGDGLLVYFGYPRAHEDDAQRAVRAGLGMLEALEQLNTHLTQERGVQVAARLGIHTGLVVVGEVGGGTRQEQLALGETPNVAARLQGLAAPNTLVTSAATLPLLGGFFACQPLGTPLLKGLAQPLAVYRVLAENMARSRLEAAGRTGWTPLVGREQEIGLLRERWAQVKDGVGQVVLLSGEAGIGKSRLVQVLQEHVAAEPQAWLTLGQCSPYYQHTALYPLIDLLERVVLRFAREESPVHKLHKLEGYLVQYGLPLAEVVPLFAALLSLPLPPDYAPLTLAPEQQKQQTLHALLTILLRIAAQQPVLLVMEDLHWVDPSTLEWLSLLVDQGPTARILALCTFRPDFRPPWTGRAHLTQVTLPRLPQQQATEMTARVAHGKALPPEVVAQIVAKTDGVPLFVEELTKMVLASDLLQEQADRYALTRPLPPLAIPATLHDALMARLDRLAAVKGIAQLGATLGREFAYALFRAVAPWDEETVQRGLQQLVAAEFLYQRGIPPQATYTFKHALIQEAAYQSLLKSTRQHYHQRITQVFEARFPEIAARQPALLAHHAGQGAVWDKALFYWQQAGTTALQRSAYHEAAGSFAQALETLPHLAPDQDTRAQAIDLCLELRSALLPLWDLDRELATLRRAEALATLLGDPQRLGRVTAELTHCLWLTADLEQALITGQRAVALLPSIQDERFHRRVKSRLARVYASLGHYGKAIELFEYLVTEEHRGPAPQAIPDLRWLAQSLAEIGAFPASRAHGEQAVRMAEEIDHPYSLSNAYNAAGYLYLCQGDLPKAIAGYRRGLQLSQQWHIVQLLHGHALGLSVALSLAGQVSEALALLEQTLAQHPVPRLLVSRQLEVPRVGEIYLRAGRVEDACQYTQTLLEFARAHQERSRQAWALWLLGEIAVCGTPQAVERAAASYQQALALAQDLGMRPLQAHCHRGLGTLYAQRGQAERARAALTTAIEMYRALDMTFWLPQTEAALGGLNLAKVEKVAR